jgi:hypothetical protein
MTEISTDLDLSAFDMLSGMATEAVPPKEAAHGDSSCDGSFTYRYICTSQA